MYIKKTSSSARFYANAFSSKTLNQILVHKKKKKSMSLCNTDSIVLYLDRLTSAQNQQVFSVQ